MPVTRLAILFDRYLAGSCSPREKSELAEFILSREQDDAIDGLLEKVWMESADGTGMPAAAADKLYHIILEEEVALTAKIHRSRFHRLRWSAAAAVVLLLGAAGYVKWFYTPLPDKALVKTASAQEVVAPGTNRAVITLANGQAVYLDSAANGQLAIQSNIRLIKLANGQVSYEAIKNEKPATIQYNTLTNPRGSKVIDISLSDGTHVWLNAGSSVTFPVAFTNNKREVTITGEAYFEVAHNMRKPFTVKAREVMVDVLGTDFNIRAYADEPYVTSTLVQGAVRVSSQVVADNHSVLLQPGLQAVRSDQTFITRKANLKQVLSWKNGLFAFEDMTLTEILREVSRWYDVDVEMLIPAEEAHYGGVINRNSTLENILHMLEKNGGNHHFKIEGRKVRVLP